MTATSLDLSQIKTDALSAASTFRSLIGLGTLATQSPTGTADSTTYLRGDFTWQTISGGGTWGSITGTLSSQTDLQNALNAKASLSGATFTGAVTITQGTVNTSVLTSTGYSLTGSNAQSLIDLAGTWNTSGAPTLIKANVTDTASASGSLLLDLQVGGTSKFKVGKDGIATASAFFVPNGNGLYNPAGNTAVLLSDTSGCKLGRYYDRHYIQINSSSTAADGNLSLLTASTTVLWKLYADNSNILAQRNDTSAQTYRLYNTYTSATSFENLQLQWASNEARIGTSVGATGGTQQNLVLGSWAANGTWTAGLTMTPAGAVTFSNNITISTKNIVTDTTTGTKIGTGTTQKLGFWNATPVVQPANTTAIDDVLVNTGLRATGGVNNFNNTLDLTIRTVTYGATMAIDAALGNKIAITLTGNGTISNPTNSVDGRVLVFRLRQDGSGNRVPVWDTKYSFVGDLATVTLSTGANKIDRVAFEYDSTDDKWYCISFIKGS